MNSLPQETKSTAGPAFARLQGTFTRWVTLGYGASLLLHLILLASMSIIVMEQAGQNPIGALWSAMGTDGGDGTDAGSGDSGGLPDMSGGPKLDKQKAVPEGSSIPFIEMPQLVSGPGTFRDLPAPQNGAPAGGEGAGEGEGKSDGTAEQPGSGGREGEFGGGFDFSIPKNGKAVIRGNFAAWTVPEDPKPKEAYKIVIQIKLPQNLKNYSLADLSGLVEGTDQYKQHIPQTVRGFLKVVDHQTQLVVDVPGAEALVKDTIFIRSRVLKESQKLEIVF